MGREEGQMTDEEEAAEFLKTYGQMQAADLKDASLKNQWRVSAHVMACKKGIQAAQLAIFASKALQGSDLSEIQRAAGEYGSAERLQRAEKLQQFKEIFTQGMADAQVEVPVKLTDRIKKRAAESRDSTPTATPESKRSRRSVKAKRPAVITKGLTVNPFEFLTSLTKKEVRKTMTFCDTRSNPWKNEKSKNERKMLVRAVR